MNSQDELVDYLMQQGILRSPHLIRAFRSADRARFIRPGNLPEAYEDYPLPIGFGQTISQPYTVAFMLEALCLRPEDTVLDIGSGSGWTTALLAHCAKEVTGVERIPELVAFARSNLAPYNLSNATITQAGPKLGIPGNTYDKILVSASAATFPEELLEQLNINGIMVIPVERSIMVLNKDSNGNVYREVFEGFVFVPLV